MWLLEVALMGGLVSVLVFIHFAVDWIFQSHSDAMIKHNNLMVRTKHCLIYTLGFVPFLMTVGFSGLEWLVALSILFVSHHIEDTYLPVFYWAKYIRKPPEMTEPRKLVEVDGYVSVLPPDPKAGFVEFVSTPLGKILMIAIDQIVHIAFLFPIAWMILQHIEK
jgi:hypothetical protein